MDGSYRTTFSYGVDEITINRSRFIGYSMPVNSEEEALVFIESIKANHRDANHNVFAYVIGENSNVQRFNDAGEPSGTAGIPVLEVIKKEDLRNIVVVVTRYFGGTKLGGGGLIRAYTKGAKIALEAGIIVDMTPHSKLTLHIDYNLYGRVENYLMTNDFVIDEISYDSEVNINISVETSNLEVFKKTMMNLTNGTIAIDHLEEIYLPLKDGKYIS